MERKCYLWSSLSGILLGVRQDSVSTKELPTTRVRSECQRHVRSPGAPAASDGRAERGLHLQTVFDHLGKSRFRSLSNSALEIKTLTTWTTCAQVYWQMADDTTLRTSLSGAGRGTNRDAAEMSEILLLQGSGCQTGIASGRMTPVPLKLSTGCLIDPVIRISLSQVGGSTALLLSRSAHDIINHKA